LRAWLFCVGATSSEPQEAVALAAPGDHGRGAGTGRALGREDLGDHAAAAQARSGTAGHRLQRRVARARFMDERGGRVLARIGAVQALLVGEDHERVRFHEVGHERAQRVVVAELDLVVDHRVVLVDHRHHAQLQEREERRARIEVALAIGEVGVREEHLRRSHAVLAQLGFVHLRQAHLAHGGGGLQFVDLVRAGGPAQALHALGDRAAGHHDHLAALLRQRRELPAPFADGAFVQAAPFVRHEAGADLHDDPPGRAQDVGAHSAASPEKRGST
jgi:hypothetical protein